MMTTAKKEFKRCPRCERKMLIDEPKCKNCGLIFARLANATNKAARKAIRHREKNKVICDAILPSDVSKWKLFWLSLLLGLFGAHRFRVGKYKTATYFFLAMVLVIIAASLGLEMWEDYYNAGIVVAMIIPAGPVVVFWAVDTVAILINKFKVPISIEESIVVPDKDDNYQEVLKTVEEINRSVSIKKIKKIREEVAKQEKAEYIDKEEEKTGKK